MSLYPLHDIFEGIEPVKTYRYTDENYLRSAYGDPSKNFPRWINDHHLCQHLNIKKKELTPFLKKLGLYPDIQITITNKNLNEDKIEELRQLIPDNPKQYHYRINPKNLLDLKRKLDYQSSKYAPASNKDSLEKEKRFPIQIEWQRDMILNQIFEKTGMVFASANQIHQKNIEQRLILAGERYIEAKDAEDHHFHNFLIANLKLFPSQTQLTIMEHLQQGISKRTKDLDFLSSTPIFSAYLLHMLKHTIKHVDTKTVTKTPSISRF